MKGIFNIILLALFCTSFTQAQVGKTFEFTYKGQTLKYVVADGNEAKVSKQRSAKISGDVKIPERVKFKGKKYRVTTIGNAAFSHCYGLTSVTIPNSVTAIGKAAFMDCDGLTSITIPNSVTTIGEAAFEECKDLTSITIPNSVTTIGYAAFRSCTSLTSVTIPNSVTRIGKYAFYSCINLRSINVAKDNSHYCSENGVLFDITKKRLIQCPCRIKGNYAIPDGVTTIGKYAFYRCDGLTSVTIPNSVTTIGKRAFRSCTGLTSVTIPNSVTTIGEEAFNYCTGLTILTIENVTPPDVRYFAFEKVSENITIYVPAESVEKYKTAEDWIWYADKIKAVEK